jgi:hypothetical protein
MLPAFPAEFIQSYPRDDRVEVNDRTLLPLLRYSPAYPVAPKSVDLGRVGLLQGCEESVHHAPSSCFSGVRFEGEGDKPRIDAADPHRPFEMTSFRFAAAVRKEPMTRRERFTLRSPAWCGIHLGAIRHVEPDIAQPIEGEASPVAIDSSQLFGQTPLDRVDAQRYFG